MANNNKKPTHTLRCGNIRATIWQNASENGPFFATTFSRPFKDQSGSWRNGTSFGFNDLEALLTVASERRGRRLLIHRRLFFFGAEEFEGEATVLDISTNGCRATSPTEVTLGLMLKLSLFLQDQQWPLRIDQAVVR